MTQSCSFVHSGLEFAEQTAELVWQTETFLELWGRVVVNPSSCFVNAGECSVRKINLSSLFIKRAATIASARLNGGITLKLFVMSWKPVLASRCSISTWDYSSTARGVWPECTDAALIMEDAKTFANQACPLKMLSSKCPTLPSLTVPVVSSLHPREFEFPWMSDCTDVANKLK